MRDVNQSLHLSLVQPLLWGMIESLALEVLRNGPGGYSVAE